MSVPSENAKGTSEDKKRDSADKPALAEGYVGKVKPEEYSSTSYTKTKYRTRKPLSKFELVTLILGGVGILVAGTTGGAILWQALTANEANIIAKQSLKDQTRPWVGIEENSFHTASSPTFTWPVAPNALPTIELNINFTIKNFGGSPAFNEGSSTWVIPIDTTPGDQPFPDKLVGILCKMSDSGMNADTIFPGSTIQRGGPQLYFAGAIKSTHLSLAWIVTCISYQDRWTKEFHHTEYVYMSAHDRTAKPTPASPDHADWTYLPISGFYVWKTSAD